MEHELIVPHRLRLLEELHGAAIRAWGAAAVGALPADEYMQMILMLSLDRIAAGEVRGFMRRVPAADKAPLVSGIE
jgi:hypothetical protein